MDIRLFYNSLVKMREEMKTGNVLLPSSAEALLNRNQVVYTTFIFIKIIVSISIFFASILMIEK